MAFTQNTGLRNVIANAIGGAFANGTLEIRTVADAVLATISLGATPFTTATTGSISKNGTWQATASASGTAAKAVFISNGGVNTAEVTVATSGGDLTIDNDSIVSGGTVTVTAFTYTENAT